MRGFCFCFSSNNLVGFGEILVDSEHSCFSYMLESFPAGRLPRLNSRRIRGSEWTSIVDFALRV